jgi:hypothetical protein
VSALLGVFGAGRNGSTLIARLLDGSPDLWLHPVDVVFLPLWNDIAERGAIRGESYRTATTRTLDHLDRPVPWRVAAPFFTPQLDEVERDYLARLEDPHPLDRRALEALDREGETGAAEFFPAFLEAAYRTAARAHAAGPSLLGFKTSETAYVDDFLRLWPGLRCLHIVREPIANYRSFKRTWSENKRAPFWTYGEDLLRVFLDARWVPHARAILRLRERAPEQHLVVRYEDLLVDAEREVLRLCEGLGIRPPSQPTRQTVLGGEALRSLPPNPSKPGVETPQQVVPDLADRFGYEEVVTEREAQLIARATGALAAEFGYDVEPELPGRLALWWRWLPVDRAERQNVDDPARFALELLKRRVYVTRTLLSS